MSPITIQKAFEKVQDSSSSLSERQGRPTHQETNSFCYAFVSPKQVNRSFFSDIVKIHELNLMGS
ncbi:hypothetical protein U27_03709 [Candidatus Vecturithrix granuli]|uniref:Uncharacterized protein n=1 Tax=Vecturithrix granuli TaxID=1499967 RepID=A0A081BWP0_VECG1|nr:hypothetical protein U27_03709 [Candidatus Vecturithrix granuli]